MTHHKDMVVHVPLDRYLHIEGEWYENPELQLRECHGYQDSECSDQWFITSISDHLLYLGVPIGSDKCDELMHLKKILRRSWQNLCERRRKQNLTST